MRRLVLLLAAAAAGLAFWRRRGGGGVPGDWTPVSDAGDRTDGHERTGPDPTLRDETASGSDDATLADRVRSEIGHDPDVPPINVNAKVGTVYLRGEVPDQALADDIGVRVAAVEGVARVVNLLHPPGTPAPHEGAAGEG